MTRRLARLLPLAALGAFALAAAGGCNKKPQPAQAAGGAHTPKADHARDQAEKLALDAVRKSAEVVAQVNPPANPPPPPRGVFDKLLGKKPAPPPVPVSARVEAPPPVTVTTRVPAAAGRGASPVVVRETVRGSLLPTEAEADEDALNQARRRVAEKLAELNPPVLHTPSALAVRTQFQKTRAVRQPTPDEKAVFDKAGLTGLDPVAVVLEVEVTDDQVRTLRSQGRVVDALRVMGAVAVVCLAGFLFLRLDDWSKGYLTSWLGVGAAVLVAGTVAVLAVVG